MDLERELRALADRLAADARASRSRSRRAAPPPPLAAASRRDRARGARRRLRGAGVARRDPPLLPPRRRHDRASSTRCRRPTSGRSTPGSARSVSLARREARRPSTLLRPAGSTAAAAPPARAAVVSLVFEHHGAAGAAERVPGGGGVFLKKLAAGGSRVDGAPVGDGRRALGLRRPARRLLRRAQSPRLAGNVAPLGGRRRRHIASRAESEQTSARSILAVSLQIPSERG